MKLSVFFGIILFNTTLNANAYIDNYNKNHGREIQSVLENSNPNSSSIGTKDFNFSLGESQEPRFQKKVPTSYDNYNRANFNDYDFNNYGR
jgi:hypothetical protein